MTDYKRVVKDERTIGQIAEALARVTPPHPEGLTPVLEVGYRTDTGDYLVCLTPLQVARMATGGEDMTRWALGRADEAA